MVARLETSLWDIGDIVKLIENGRATVLFALIERLFMIIAFGSLTLWLANDMRRNIQTGAVPTHTIWSWNQIVTRAQRPFTYWGKVALKMAGVFAAAIMTAWYFYLSATY